MRLRAQGFLLFSFAFSSTLTLTETLQISENGKPISASSNMTETQKPENKTEVDIDHGLNKRSAETLSEAFPKEGEKKQEFYEPNLVFKQNTADKRTRLGFTGMRGKKEFSADDYCARNLRTKLEGALNKRYFRSFSDLLGDKRASMAFHGMRGKKSQEEDNEILAPETLDYFPRQEFLINTGLMDEPGEMADLQSDIKSEDYNLEEEGLNKRSPYAFQGMRGKKENLYDLKRAMGFLGMRGKKASEVWDSDPNYKRAPQTSFFGMKGKKAQSSGFFGMRGKKASPNAFFGIKGKREPLGYDFQNFSLLNQMKDSGSSSNRFRRGITWLKNSKKAKSAFFGIRGKKSTEGRPGFTISSSF